VNRNGKSQTEAGQSIETSHNVESTTFLRDRLYPSDSFEGHALELRARQAHDCWARDRLELTRFIDRDDLRDLVNKSLVVADLIAVCLELEGEKSALQAEYELADQLCGEERIRARLGLARQLHVAIDSQLEHLVGLRHLCSTIVLRTIASHPRYSTIDFKKRKPPAGSDQWGALTQRPRSVNGSKSTDLGILHLAETINDAQLVELATVLTAIDPDGHWANLISIRNKRHHEGARWVSPGITIFPEERPVLKIDGRWFRTKSGTWNLEAEAVTKMSKAGAPATLLLEGGLPGMVVLAREWLKTIEYIFGPPERPVDAADNFVPRSAEKGKFPYLLRMAVSPADQFESDRSIFNPSKKKALLGYTPEPLSHGRYRKSVAAASFADAVARVRGELEPRGYHPAEFQSVRSW
jgi:hypothetical protein